MLLTLVSAPPDLLQLQLQILQKLRMGFFNHITSHNIKKISNTSKGIHVIPKLQCRVIFFLSYRLAVQERYLGLEFLISLSILQRTLFIRKIILLPLSFPPELHPSLFQLTPLSGIPALTSRELSAHNNI